MTNKIKFNRFERSLPDNNGFVVINSNASALDTISSTELAEKYNLSNASSGLTFKMVNGQLMLTKGHTFLDTVCDYYLEINSNQQHFHSNYPLWDINVTYQFQPMDLTVNNYQVRYTTNLYNTNGDGGLDSSTGETLKYYLCRIKNHINEYNMIITSYADKPIMNEGDELLYYVPINNEYHYKKILDKKYLEITQDFIIDMPTLQPNALYPYVLSQSADTDFENNGEVFREIGYFVTASDSTSIVRYYPTQDLATSYQNRYIIKEQSGTTGYRIYSDGWKEQWGNLVNPVFPVAFNEIPLSISRGASAVTRTGMTIAAGYWFAKGY